MRKTVAKPPSTFTEFRRLSPGSTGGLLRMRQEAYRDAAVDGKYKLLTAMAISIAIRCEPCIRVCDDWRMTKAYLNRN